MSSSRGTFESTVTANTAICREHFRLTLRVAAFPPTTPGQFVQIACNSPAEVPDDQVEHAWDDGSWPRLNGVELQSAAAVLRRPFSLAGRRDTADGVELDIIHRVVGKGTNWLSRLVKGDGVGVLGPLGNGFTLPSEGQIAVMIGGGVGIPPMIYLAEKLVGKKAVAFAGAVTRDLLALSVTTDAPPPSFYDTDPLYNIAEFSKFGIPAVISTDDGSYGFRGYVTQAMEKYLDKLPTDTGVMIYTCGPEPMMKRVADIALSRGLGCQVAVERAMACGMGTCQSCCIRVKKPDPAAVPMPGQAWAYRLSCTDGPVFAAGDLLW